MCGVNSIVVKDAIDEYYKRSKLLWRAPLVSYDYSLRCYVKNDGWFNEHIDVSPMDPLLCLDCMQLLYT